MSLGTGGKNAIADACDITPQSVTGWIRTGRISTKNLLIIERLTNYKMEWLLSGKGSKYAIDGEVVRKELSSAASPYSLATGGSNVIAYHPDDPIPEGFVAIPKYKVSFSAGNGHAVNYELIEEGEPAMYRQSWLIKERINPQHIKRFEVVGDSNEPWVFSGESILVNLAENDFQQIIDGCVYAIRYGDELRIKRLYKQLDGSLVLKSYNPDYKDEHVRADLVAEHITLIGRVRDRSGAGQKA